MEILTSKISDPLGAIGGHLKILLLLLILGLLPVIASARPQIMTGPDEKIEIDDAPEMEVIAVSKNVVIHKQAKAVFVLGGDVIVEGNVSEDVGVIGGNVIQKKGAYVGGDVIVFGGKYLSEDAKPLRGENKETIVLSVLEDWFRSIAQDPASLLAPSYTPAFFAQRILSVIFWFVITLAFATIAPGGVSRAIERMRLSTLKIAAIGLAGVIVSSIVFALSISFLPDYLGVMAGLMIFALLLLALLFGRVTLNLSVGKLMQKHFVPRGKGRESIAILLGSIFWTILLSIPYIWPLALLTLFSAGIGLVVTGRNSPEMQKPARSKGI